jgi:hypothetical protein
MLLLLPLLLLMASQLTVGWWAASWLAVLLLLLLVVVEAPASRSCGCDLGTEHACPQATAQAATPAAATPAEGRCRVRQRCLRSFCCLCFPRSAPCAATNKPWIHLQTQRGNRAPLNLRKQTTVPAGTAAPTLLV